MRTSISIAACAIGLASLVQYCPAPPLAAIIGVTTGELLTAGTTLAGSAITAGAAAGSRRDIPAGVSQESIDQCVSSLAGVQVNFVPQSDGLLVENMPAPCMNLATVITGDYNAGNPIPMSSSSILFRGLTQDQLQQIQDTLDGN
ncbi:unnamed protein product [Aureobasidium uvarum]|uniref:Uncharacterized protein n=1 Tax=Aureobasidium uvarum TaxID=2773716 RepID=A0A9N8KNV8_9PEZI|nr:unnamed protein product [Aureobasidium uvarum]